MKLLLALLAALLCSGCFVFDEIEKGQAIMKAHDGIGEAAEENPAETKDTSKTPRERLAEYYAKQRAKASEPSKSMDPADDVGLCRMRNGSQFMRRSDCKLRGGTFAQ